MTQTPRDWQKDMEMCEAATRGPWKVFKGVVETLIGTAYDHPQMKGPDSIVGRAISARGDYVYIRENDATLLAEARTALPYWLQEAKRLQESLDIAHMAYEGLQEDCVSRGEYASLLGKLTSMTAARKAEKARADAAEERHKAASNDRDAIYEHWRVAEARELRTRTELESMMPDMWPGMREHFEVLLSTLYPDTPAPTAAKEDEPCHICGNDPAKMMFCSAVHPTPAPKEGIHD